MTAKFNCILQNCKINLRTLPSIFTTASHAVSVASADSNRTARFLRIRIINNLSDAILKHNISHRARAAALPKKQNRKWSEYMVQARFDSNNYVDCAATAVITTKTFWKTRGTLRTIWAEEYSNALEFTWVILLLLFLFSESKVIECLSFNYFQVKRSDILPTKLCHNCFDKINEFVRFRESCAATDIGLRILFGLPDEYDETCAIYGPGFRPQIIVVAREYLRIEEGLQNEARNRIDINIISSDTKL